jgi:rod shape-determining protein MreB
MFSRKIGIDLGTAFFRVCSNENKNISSAKNILIMNPLTEEIVFKGDKAFEIYGKEGAELKAIKPVKNGILQETFYQKELLLENVNQIMGRNRLVRPEFVVSIPLKLRESDKNSITVLLEELGARSTSMLVPEVILSAIGLKLPIHRSTGMAIVNLGAGTTEIAVMSLGGVVVGDSFSFGGDDLDQMIIDSFRTLNLEIGKKTAESMKFLYGSAEVIDVSAFSEIKGKDLATGKIVSFPFKIDLIRSSITPGLERIAEAIKLVLEKLPPELASDIMDNGVIITGGGSKLKNLHFYLSNYLNVPVYRVEDRPENSCINGIQYIINNSEVLNKSYYIK